MVANHEIESLLSGCVTRIYQSAAAWHCHGIDMCLYSLLPVVVLSLVVGCSTTINNLGLCEEADGIVTAACLYNGNYPACDLAEESYAAARESAWRLATSQLATQYHYGDSDTGLSQDLGEVCRFYVRANPASSPLREPYQWMIYVDKRDLQATKIVPVSW